MSGQERRASWVVRFVLLKARWIRVDQACHAERILPLGARWIRVDQDTSCRDSYPWEHGGSEWIRTRPAERLMPLGARRIRVDHEDTLPLGLRSVSRGPPWPPEVGCAWCSSEKQRGYTAAGQSMLDYSLGEPYGCSHIRF